MTSDGTEKDIIERLRLFLKRLRQGEFEDQREQAFGELNLLTRKSKEAKLFLRDQYLPGLYHEDSGGKHQLIFIASSTLDCPVADLATVVAEVLIDLFASNPNDQEILSVLIDIVLRYNLYGLIGLESGHTFRFETSQQSFPLDVDLVQADIRLRLLHFTLKKYSKILVDDGPPSPQELPSVIDRLDAVIGLILGFQDSKELVRHTALQPFIQGNLSYSSEQSQWLFGSSMGIPGYEEELFKLYRIPLFPIIKADRLTFENGKLTFTNEGRGALPPCTVRCQVGEDEFELGALSVRVPPEKKHDIFVEEDATFASFLRGKNPNSDVKAVFSFRKFERSYDFGLLARSVGHWLDGISRKARDRGVPYEIPLERLNEREFERLCFWIVSANPDRREFCDVTWLNEDGGSERGRDVIAIEADTGRKWVFQCKRVKEYGPKDIEEELTKFRRYVARDPSIKPDVYVLFISRSITDKTKKKGDVLAAKIGMEIKYWPKSTIDRLVRTDEEIEDRFWRDFGD